MGLMTFRDAFDMVHHDMKEDCLISTHNPYRETAIWNKSLNNFKGKETLMIGEGSRV